LLLPSLATLLCGFVDRPSPCRAGIAASETLKYLSAGLCCHHPHLATRTVRATIVERLLLR
jgi:hypothetical protein